MWPVALSFRQIGELARREVQREGRVEVREPGKKFHLTSHGRVPRLAGVYSTVASILASRDYHGFVALVDFLTLDYLYEPAPNIIQKLQLESVGYSSFPTSR